MKIVTIKADIEPYFFFFFFNFFSLAAATDTAPSWISSFSSDLAIVFLPTCA